MRKVEIRVRPVLRHIITRFTEERASPHDAPPEYTRKVETLGEFDSELQAEEVAKCLTEVHLAYQARLRSESKPPKEYVIVQQRPGEIEARVMYAYSEAEVEVRIAEMQSPDGPGCKVFSRERDMTIPG